MLSVEAANSHHKRQPVGTGLELCADLIPGLSATCRERDGISDFVVCDFWNLGKLSFLGAEAAEEM